jgi:hypothetical protein
MVNNRKQNTSDRPAKQGVRDVSHSGTQQNRGFHAYLSEPLCAVEQRDLEAWHSMRSP